MSSFEDLDKIPVIPAGNFNKKKDEKILHQARRLAGLEDTRGDRGCRGLSSVFTQRVVDEWAEWQSKQAQRAAAKPKFKLPLLYAPPKGASSDESRDGAQASAGTREDRRPDQQIVSHSDWPGQSESYKKDQAARDRVLKKKAEVHVLLSKDEHIIQYYEPIEEKYEGQLWFSVMKVMTLNPGLDTTNGESVIQCQTLLPAFTLKPSDSIATEASEENLRSQKLASIRKSVGVRRDSLIGKPFKVGSSTKTIRAAAVAAVYHTMRQKSAEWEKGEGRASSSSESGSDSDSSDSGDDAEIHNRRDSSVSDGSDGEDERGRHVASSGGAAAHHRYPRAAHHSGAASKACADSPASAQSSDDEPGESASEPQEKERPPATAVVKMKGKGKGKAGGSAK